MKYSLKHRNFFTECDADIKNQTLEKAALWDLREKFAYTQRGVGGGNHPPLGHRRVNLGNVFLFFF